MLFGQTHYLADTLTQIAEVLFIICQNCFDVMFFICNGQNGQIWQVSRYGMQSTH